jgi:two-component system, NarL family, sensor histidine kinase LiaS
MLKSYPLVMRSVAVRLYVMSVLLTLVTAFVVIVIAYFTEFGLPTDDAMARLLIAAYRPGNCEICLPYKNEHGYILDANGQVSFVWGDLPCKPGDQAEQCFLEDGWHQRRESLENGRVAVARVNPQAPTVGHDFFSVLWRYFRWVIIIAIPLSLVLSLGVVTPLLRRLQRIAVTSRAVASGNLEARTNETRFDEIGQLGQQFDYMATTISRQVQELRDLAKSNSMLALAAERNARAAERLALSRDLHDSVSQHLFSLAMGTNDLASLIRRDPNKAASQAEQLSTMAAQAQDDLREVLSQLRSETTGQGLLESITDFINLWRKRYEISVSLNVHLQRALPIVLENVLYRVCQEAFNNIARHAKAKNVTVTLKQEAEGFCLHITDDGQGFNVEAENMGFGLLGMRERVRAVGGTLELNSSSKGTTLQVHIPVGNLVSA